MTGSDPSGLDFSLTPPDYGGRCVTQILPALISGVPNDVVPPEVITADAVVLFVIDGLGWHQLRRWGEHAPFLSGRSENRAPPPAITTVAPSTTSAALTAITTGATPGEHGLVGLAVGTPEGPLKVLSWAVTHLQTRETHDARQLVAPEQFQPVEPFAGSRAVVITRQKFASSGFTAAHLRGAHFDGWNQPGEIVPQIIRHIGQGERLIYAYFDELDQTAHEHGLGERYQQTLTEVDTMIETLLYALPTNVALLVTADHGVLHISQPQIGLDEEVLALTAYSSGEPRFRWLHAQPGCIPKLQAAAQKYSGTALVMTQQQVLEAGWLGLHVSTAAQQRLGDILLLPQEPVTFAAVRPTDKPRRKLIGHHGGLSAEEMLVPLAAYRGRGQ